MNNLVCSKIDTLGDAIQKYLSTIQKQTTRLTYTRAFSSLVKYGILNVHDTVETIAKIKSSIFNDVFSLKLSMSSKKVYSSAIISLFRFMNLLSDGYVPILKPVKIGTHSLFHGGKTKSTTNVLPISELNRIIDYMYTKNESYGLIFQLLGSYAKRISEVLNLRVTDIVGNTIRFAQLKRSTKDIYITCTVLNENMMNHINSVKGTRKDGYLFLNRNGKPIAYSHIERLLVRCGKELNLDLHTHMFRTSVITSLFKHNITSEAIKKLSGHSHINMVFYYDKTSESNNITKSMDILTLGD